MEAASRLTEGAHVRRDTASGAIVEIVSREKGADRVSCRVRVIVRWNDGSLEQFAAGAIREIEEGRSSVVLEG